MIFETEEVLVKNKVERPSHRGKNNTKEVLKEFKGVLNEWLSIRSCDMLF
jgi:hypothetical protein